MLIQVILFSLLKTQKYELFSSIYQQEITKNYRNFLVMDLKDRFIGINIKQNMRIETQEINIDIFWN